VSWLIGLGIPAAVAAMASVILSVRPTRRSPKEMIVEAGDRLVFALGQIAGDPIRPDSFVLNEAILAFPQGKEKNHENLIILLKMDPTSFKPPTRVEWTVGGIIAYSAICTHLGCHVRFSEEPMAGAPFHHIHCPCHAGLFDATRGAIVVGGPPRRPLPQLAIGLGEGGEIVAAGSFTEPVGVI